MVVGNRRGINQYEWIKGEQQHEDNARELESDFVVCKKIIL